MFFHPVIPMESMLLAQSAVEKSIASTQPKGNENFSAQTKAIGSPTASDGFCVRIYGVSKRAYCSSRRLNTSVNRATVSIIPMTMK